jgi:ABC-type branched-subunit amino acid transport system ATPase component
MGADGTGRTAAADNVLEVRELRKRFGGNQAVDGVTFEVGYGEIVGLIGDNGSGKTTTLNLLTRLLRWDSGSVLIGGTDVLGMTPHDVAGLGLSRTFQVPQLVGDLTAGQNIETGKLRSSGAGLTRSMFLPWREARLSKIRAAEARDIARRLGLPDAVTETRVDKLALGLRRLVEVGRALAANAQIVCLDEPTAGLNDVEIAELLRVLRSVRESGGSVLVVEHHVPFVLDLCDKLVLMEQGTVKDTFREFRRDDLPERLAEYVRHVPSIAQLGIKVPRAKAD